LQTRSNRGGGGRESGRTRPEARSKRRPVVEKANDSTRKERGWEYSVHWERCCGFRTCGARAGGGVAPFGKKEKTRATRLGSSDPALENACKSCQHYEKKAHLTDHRAQDGARKNGNRAGSSGKDCQAILQECSLEVNERF